MNGIIDIQAVIKIDKSDFDFKKWAEAMNEPRPIVSIDKPVWTSVKDELPPEGKYVEVCTKTGQVYVSSVLCGKFPADIGWWKELPELPEEVRKNKQTLESK